MPHRGSRPRTLTAPDAWVVFMGLLSLPILLPYGNLAAIDAYFFGASASTMSGLNTYAPGPPRLVETLTRSSHDCKDLALYQQLYIYFVPLLTNLGFVNIMVVVVRLYWFSKRIDKLGGQPRLLVCPLYRLTPCLSKAMLSSGLADAWPLTRARHSTPSASLPSLGPRARLPRRRIRTRSHLCNGALCNGASRLCPRTGFTRRRRRLLACLAD